jgi:biopolymer transport protein ExbB
VRAVSRGDHAGAIGLAGRSKAPVARVAQAMLRSGAPDEESLQNAADGEATLCLPDLTRRLPHLGVLANSATLIGLLGTITGLITAISGVGVADAAQRSAYLSAGISEALHTTAFGLVIAIPTLMIQGWLNSRVEDIAQDVDEVSVRLSQAMAKSGSGASHVVPLSRAHASGAMPASPMGRPAAGFSGGQ